MRILKLNNTGYSHDVALSLFIFIFAITGATYLLITSADPFTSGNPSKCTQKIVHAPSTNALSQLSLYHNPVIGDYYTYLGRNDITLASYGYCYQENLGYAYKSKVQGSVPLYRLYNPSTKLHFLTLNPVVDQVNGYLNDGVAAYLNSSGGYDLQPINNFTNNLGKHYYSLSSAGPNGYINQAVIAYSWINAATPEKHHNQFYIVGNKIIDPNGHIFLPIGANVGIHNNNFDQAGTALGQSAQALAWGWNTVRLNVYCTSAEPNSEVNARSGDNILINKIDQVVQEYTSKHIVVILECHDAEHNSNDAANFWESIAIKYKTNPYVWFNYANEPDGANQAKWITDQQTWLKQIRSTGTENIFVADVLNYGNDAGLYNTKQVFYPTVGPALIAKQCNVLFSLHNYGGQANSTDYIMHPDIYDNYWHNVQQAGIAMVVGEFGLDYQLKFNQVNGKVEVVSYNGSTSPSTIASDIYNHVANGAYATIHDANKFGIGMIAWHATANDKYRLATPLNGITLSNGTYSGKANFYNILNSTSNGLQPGFTFTQLGSDLWYASHHQPDLGNFSGSFTDSNCSSVGGDAAIPTAPLLLKPVGTTPNV